MLKKVEHVVSSLTLLLPLIQIFLDGVDTRTVSLESLRNRISVVPQDTSLFDETVEYNLRLRSTSLFSRLLLHCTPLARMHTTPASPVVFYFVFTSYHHLLVSFISLYHFTLLFYFCPTLLNHIKQLHTTGTAMTAPPQPTLHLLLRSATC